jgi:hypothetical protein
VREPHEIPAVTCAAHVNSDVFFTKHWGHAPLRNARGRVGR